VFPRRDDRDAADSSDGLTCVVLERDRVLEVPTGVVDEEDNGTAVWVTPVTFFVDRDLFEQLSLSQARARHLRLDHDALVSNEQVQSGRSGGMRRRRLFVADVTKMQSWGGVKGILHVVLVFHFERGPPVMPLSELIYERWEPTAELFDQVNAVAPAASEWSSFDHGFRSNS
jgi:hypothetical protein